MVELLQQYIYLVWTFTGSMVGFIALIEAIKLYNRSGFEPPLKIYAGIALSWVGSAFMVRGWFSVWLVSHELSLNLIPLHSPWIIAGGLMTIAGALFHLSTFGVKWVRWFLLINIISLSVMYLTHLKF